MKWNPMNGPMDQCVDQMNGPMDQTERPYPRRPRVLVASHVGVHVRFAQQTDVGAHRLVEQVLAAVVQHLVRVLTPRPAPLFCFFVFYDDDAFACSICILRFELHDGTEGGMI